MFHVVSGSFQPVLESSLVKEVRDLKSADPSAPLAIVVPSEILRRRVQWLLCVEQRLALYDVHFLTFHQLALRLHAEQVQSGVRGGNLSIDLVSDLTLRQILREILGRNTLALQSLSQFRQSPGLCAALWTTIRDLHDAMVDPSTMLQGLQEGLFEEEAQDRLRTLFSLHALMHEEMASRQIGSPDDLARSLIPWVADSSLLARLRRVCYYGFYDLSQVQLSLFEAVTQKSQVTVYVPLVDDSAFAFVQRFYDRHLSAGIVGELSKSAVPINPEQGHSLSNPPVVKVMNAVGVVDELTVVCKEIGNLIELHGYRFEEIGVVARTLDPYHAWLSRTFEEHRIPCALSIVKPLIHEPIMKLLLQLGTLVLNRFPSTDLFDVVRSPYYQINRISDQQKLIQPKLWEELIQGLGITRGQEQWNRLSTVAESGTGEVYDRVTNTRKHEPLKSTLKSLRLFNWLVQELIVDCQALPTKGHIDELTEAFMQLIGKHLDFSDVESESHASRTYSSRTATATQVVPYLREQLRQLGCLQEAITWQEWMELLLQLAEEGSLPMDAEPCCGVRVLDAMTARGLPFRALFVLGMNEKIFPRYIREDAFLRDAHRRVLAETFGYKIDEKLSGYDEERLLFALLQQAAKDRLYLSYQRADEEGRQLVPSFYLRAWNGTGSHGDLDHVYSLPRRFSDRLDDSLFRDSLLTPDELSLKLILGRINPSILLEHFGRQGPLFQQGCKALTDIERQTKELGRFDGMLEPIDDYWQSLTSQGISPTALESYARCPFQYYASHLLHMSTAKNLLTDELTPSVIGTLCHSVLRKVYSQLILEDWPSRQFVVSKSRDLISAVTEEVFAAYAHEHATGYGVVWQLYKDMVEALAHAEVETSHEECLRTGFRPIAVEVEAEGQMTLPDSGPHGFKVSGRLDRIDSHDETKRFRIIDYKFKLGSKIKSQERNLLASSVRGIALQPSLYSLMSTFRIGSKSDAVHYPLLPELVSFVYLAPHRIPLVNRATFERAAWDRAVGQQLKKTMSLLLTGMKNGQYFILPGTYCEHCSLSTSCRRDHAPTMSRSYQSGQAKQLRILRKQEIVRD